MKNKAILKHISNILFLYFFTIYLVGCGGIGGDDSRENYGWVTIEYPTTEKEYTISTDAIHLKGEAFIGWDSTCCIGTAEQLTDVMVFWYNETTGKSGKAGQVVEVDYLWPYWKSIDNHNWGATIPLAKGDNVITIKAEDSAMGDSVTTSIIVKSEPRLPIIISASAIALNADSATFETEVDIPGLPAEIWFEWSNDPSLTYCISAPKGSTLSPTPMVIRHTLSGLSQETTYYYRAAASNGVTVKGDIVSFTTGVLGDGSYWAKTYGGKEQDFARIICETSDYGYIVAGVTNSFGELGEHYFSTIWALKRTIDG